MPRRPAQGLSGSHHRGDVRARRRRRSPRRRGSTGTWLAAHRGPAHASRDVRAGFYECRFAGAVCDPLRRRGRPVRTSAYARQHRSRHRGAGAGPRPPIRLGRCLSLCALSRPAGAVGWQGERSTWRHQPGRAVSPSRRDARLYAARNGKPAQPDRRRKRPRVPRRLLPRSTRRPARAWTRCAGRVLVHVR